MVFSILNGFSILAWKSRGQRSLASYSPWGHKESDTTEHTHTIVNNRVLKGCCKDLTKDEIFFLT